MRQYRVIDINGIKPEEYASFGIALMVMRMHNWECRSIIDGKLRMMKRYSKVLITLLATSIKIIYLLGL